MGYVYYPTAHSKLSPLDRKVRVTGEIASAPIPELNVETLAHEFFKRLDKEFHLESEKFEIIYSGNSNAMPIESGESAYPSIIIRQDALVSADVFYTALRFEYGNVLAQKRVSGTMADEDLQHFNKQYSDCFNDAMYELGCDVSVLLNAKGHYFTDAVMCKKCGRLIHLSTSQEEALTWFNSMPNEYSCKCKARKVSGKNKELNFCLVDGKTAYETFIETSKRIDNERTAIKDNLYNAAKEQKLAEIKAFKSKAETLEMRLAAERSSQDVMLAGIDAFIGDSFVHKTLGRGKISEIKDGRIKASFENGKSIVLSIRTLAENNLISFTSDSIKNNCFKQYSKLLNEERGIIEDIEAVSKIISEIERRDIAEYLKAIKEAKKKSPSKDQRDIIGIYQNDSIAGNSLSKEIKEVA